MYSSAMSQPDTAAAAATAASSTDPDQEQEKDEPCNFEPCREAPLMEREEEETIAVEESLGNTWPLHVSPIHSSVNQMLCASQTLDAVTLTPEVVPPPVVPQPLHPTPVIYSPRLDWDQSGLKESLTLIIEMEDGCRTAAPTRMVKISSMFQIGGAVSGWGSQSSSL